MRAQLSGTRYAVRSAIRNIIHIALALSFIFYRDVHTLLCAGAIYNSSIKQLLMLIILLLYSIIK